MAAFLLRQSRIARFLHHAIPTRHGADRTYLVIHLVSHSRVFPFRWHRAKSGKYASTGISAKGTERCRKTVPSGRTAACRRRKRPERDHFQLCRMGQSRRRCPPDLSDLQVGQAGTEGIEVLPTRRPTAVKRIKYNSTRKPVASAP